MTHTGRLLARRHREARNAPWRAMAQRRALLLVDCFGASLLAMTRVKQFTGFGIAPACPHGAAAGRGRLTLRWQGLFVGQGGEDYSPEVASNVHGVDLQEAVGFFRQPFLDGMHDSVML